MGFASSRARIREDRDKITEELAPGDWMMFESPELNVVPFWIGRAMSKAEWDNCWWYKNKTPRRLRLAGDLLLIRESMQ